jgi:predicted GIY-YIG superfamily endonuclease
MKMLLVLVAKADNLLSAYVYLYKTSHIQCNILNMTSVYFVQNIQNHKIYVGVTTGLIQDRWKKHVSKAKTGSRLKFHCAIRKYGPESFFWVEAGSFEILSDAYEREEILIRMLDSRNTGYNTAHGGTDGVRKEITIAGISYSSCCAAAKAHGVKYRVMMNRINKQGMNPEEAVTLDRYSSSTRAIVIQGKSYASLAAAALHFGFRKNCVFKRVSRGWTVEEALELSQRPKSEPKIRKIPSAKAGSPRAKVSHSRPAHMKRHVLVNGVALSYSRAAETLGYHCSAISKIVAREKVTPQQAFEILRARKESK